MVDLDADAHQYRLDEIKELEAEIKRLRAKFEEIYWLHHNDAYDIFLRDDATYEIVCEELESKL